MALMNIASKIGSAINRSAGGLFARLSSSLSVLPRETEIEESKKIINTVNSLALQNVSRSFAIVHLLGKQWRVTDGDLLMVEGHWAPKLGDEINLEKVLLAGTKDFSLIGRPLVQPGLVKVKATVVAKTLSHTKTRFRKKKRKQFMRINFHRAHLTTLRINSVSIGSNLNQPSNVLEAI